MKNKNINKKINLKKQPYRGLIKEIAIEQGVTQQAISKALKFRNPRIIGLVSVKIKERNDAIRSYEKLCV